MGRLAFSIRDGMLFVGSDVPYATRFQHGGVSRQQITPGIRRNLVTMLKRLRGRRKGGQKTVEEKRLGFLFGINELVTTSPPRPFIGVTPETQHDIEVALANALGGKVA